MTRRASFAPLEAISVPSSRQALHVAGVGVGQRHRHGVAVGDGIARRQNPPFGRVAKRQTDGHRLLLVGWERGMLRRWAKTTEIDLFCDKYLFSILPNQQRARSDFRLIYYVVNYGRVGKYIMRKSKRYTDRHTERHKEATAVGKMGRVRMVAPAAARKGKGNECGDRRHRGPSR
jgi:hypothetical protein